MAYIYTDTWVPAGTVRTVKCPNCGYCPCCGKPDIPGETVPGSDTE